MRPYPSGAGYYRIPFNYIDGSAILDGTRVYNYILYMEEKDAKKVQKNRKSSS